MVPDLIAKKIAEKLGVAAFGTVGGGLAAGAFSAAQTTAEFTNLVNRLDDGTARSSAVWIEKIRTLEGEPMLAGRVSQLVDAMASFGAQDPAETELPMSYPTNLVPLVAPAWHP